MPSILLTPDKQKNLAFFCRLLKETVKISFLYYNDRLEVFNYASDWEAQLKNFFLLNCPFDTASLAAPSADPRPVIYSDALNLCWIIQPIPEMSAFMVGGPVVESDLNYTTLQRQFSFNDMSVSSRSAFMKLLENIPVIPRSSLMRYALMLHYAIYDENCEVRFPEVDPALVPRKAAGSDSPGLSSDTAEKIRSIPGFHGSRATELQMLDRVRNGIPEEISPSDMMHDNEVGVLSKGDPLRQAKNLIITQITLVSRAALDGGMSVEDSFSLSDYYIQKVELAEKVNDVYLISREMVRSYTQAVHDLKEQPRSAIVSYAISYINKHITEEIDLKSIGEAIGYDPYYVADRFHKETGQTVKAFILDKKTEQAKILLRSTALPVQEISDRLCFKSPSYFATQFKKCAGMTPGEYRKPDSDPTAGG